jgi:VTC domain-containing protein
MPAVSDDPGLAAELESAIASLPPVALDVLDERARLQRRVDRKYLVPQDRFVEILGELEDDEEVLEIDGRRRFGYESVYFDTRDRRCFVEHVEDRCPRFKVRTRLYADSSRCEAEVKVKRCDGDTAKRQMEYEPELRTELTPEAREFVVRAVGEAGADPPDELVRSLTTQFSRFTIVAADRPERTTVDVDVRLTAAAGSRARLAGELALVETKTCDGSGRVDSLLEAAGIEEVSLSKYRIGIALLERPEADRDYLAERACFFDVEREAGAPE